MVEHHKRFDPAYTDGKNKVSRRRRGETGRGLGARTLRLFSALPLTFPPRIPQAKLIGDFNFFSSYMSQPKTQLETFAAWAGKDSGKFSSPPRAKASADFPCATIQTSPTTSILTTLTSTLGECSWLDSDPRPKLIPRLNPR